MKKALVGMTLAAMLLASGCGTFGASGNSDYWEAANVSRVNAVDHSESLEDAVDATAKAVEAAEKTRAAAIEAADARRRDALESASGSAAIDAVEKAYTAAIEAARDRFDATVRPVRDVEEKWRAAFDAATAATFANVAAAMAIESSDVYMAVLDDVTESTEAAAEEASRRAVEASSAIYEAEIAEMDYRKAAIDAGAWTEE